MGYMGFGLQKWIYTMKPRRPFSKDRKPTGNTLANSSHEFLSDLPISKKAKFKGKVNEKNLDLRIQAAKKRYRWERIENFIILGIVIIGIIVLIFLLK